MQSLNRRSVAFGACLSLLAGYVDAIGFLDLGGFFVSFMSGNTTRMGIGAGRGNAEWVLLALGLIVLFVAGVVGGSLLSRKVGEDRRRPAVLWSVAGLLAVGAMLHAAMHVRLGTACMVMAMGLENTVLRRNSISIGLTYMTGNLVRMGHAIADSFHGGQKRDILRYLIIWVGLVLGAASGALAHQHIDMSSLWLSAGFAAILAAWAGREKFRTAKSGRE